MISKLLGDRLLKFMDSHLLKNMSTSVGSNIDKLYKSWFCNTTKLFYFTSLSEPSSKCRLKSSRNIASLSKDHRQKFGKLPETSSEAVYLDLFVGGLQRHKVH